VSHWSRRETIPTEEVLRELAEEARVAGESEIVVETTHEAGEAWIRAGFAELARTLSISLEALEGRMGPAKEPSLGSVHVQSDDLDAVVRAVRTFVPRLGHSEGSVVLPPAEGWIAVFDELTEREPELLRRLAREISDRMGAFVIAVGAEEGRVVRYVALERGRVVDEYLSVPEYYGELPPGEVIALGANPRLMSRMTGADTDEVRRVAQTGDSPEALPPTRELLAGIARLFGVPAAEMSFRDALGAQGAIAVER
jgi:hypothetical protein